MFLSVTLTSILRVTAVANSVRNQQDQTWNFIQRGIWTLIEANLGIICACLIVLKRLVKRWTRSLTSAARAGRLHMSRSGYGGGAVKVHTDGTAQQPHPGSSTKQHREPGDRVSSAGTPASVGLERYFVRADNTQKVLKPYALEPLARPSTYNNRRKSDEKRISSSSSIEQEPS